MVDAAKDWLAPYWQNLWVHGSPSTTNNPAQVWIWNPGTNPSVVVARFYDINGAILTVDEQSVPPFSCRLFKATPTEQGWCHITSQHPVLPWGLTGYQTHVQEGFVNMNFYRGDAEILKLHVPTTAPHK